MTTLPIECHYCGKELEHDQLEICPYCRILLPRFHTSILILEEQKRHPDPKKRMEAKMAVELRSWLAETLPSFEPIEVSDHTLKLNLRFPEMPLKLGAKVLVVGEAGVGKTSLTTETTGSSLLPRYRNTLGVSLGTKMVHCEWGSMNLVFWNLAPFLRSRHNFHHYCDGTEAVIFVFSVEDRASFENLSKWMDQIHYEQGWLPAAIIGNKADLVERRRVPFENARSFAEQYGILYTEISARDEPLPDIVLENLATAIKNHWNLDIEPGGNPQ